MAVMEQRPAQLLPSHLVCLAPFPVGPVPLGAYSMGSSSLHMLKGLDVPLYEMCKCDNATVMNVN